MLKFEREDGRYYYMDIARDMFRAPVLRIIRGGHRVRVERTYGFGTIHQCEKEIERLSKIRIRHGYSIVS
jgi:hypothetical protein